MSTLRLSTLSLILAIAVITLGYTNLAFAGKPEKCPDHPRCDDGGGGGGGGGITYSAALIDPVDADGNSTEHVGAFTLPSTSFTTNRKQNGLLPNSESVLTFSRPTDTDAAAAWDAVFAACENFFGPEPIGVGPTPIVVSEFTALAEPDTWEISQSGGVAVGISIEFDVTGKSTVGTTNPVHFFIFLALHGNTFFNNPKDPWLPGDSETVQYEIVEAAISGGTVRGATPKAGCVTDGRAPRTLLGDNKSTLEITSP